MTCLGLAAAFSAFAWGGNAGGAESVPEKEDGGSAPAKVYFIKDINARNLVRIYEALGREAAGKVAVKLSTGEPGNDNYLDPQLIKDLVRKVDGTIVECNTAYGGGRSNTESHLKAARDHGFTAIAPVVIMVLVFAAERYQAGNFFALGLPFLLGVGMALPWPLAGAGLAVLPKPGRFMIAVKYLFGAVILAAAVFYGVTGWRLLPGSYSPEAEVEHLRSRLALALEERKPVLIIFWATWCKNCVEMEKEVLPAPEVQKELERYTLVHFQAEDPSDPAVAGLMNRWELPGLPAFVILTPR